MRMLPALSGLFLAATLAAPLHAQAQFVETFDEVGVVGPGQSGPANLLNAGWEFRNQSQPLGSSTWVPGTFFTPQAGAGTIQTDSLSADFFGGQISHWILLPSIAGQKPGDVLTFHARSVASSNLDTLQVRYSPSGGTGTGSGSVAVGDYTELLLDIAPMSTSGWVAYSVTLPGNGPIALRYFVDWACNFGCGSSVVAIDTLSVGEPPPPPCNLPPMPSPGGTVNWIAADSPYRVCSDTTVPLGTTVIIEAGVTIDIDLGKTLAVDGTMIAQGTTLAPVTFTGGFSTVTPPIDVHGLADLTGVTVLCRLQVANGGSLLLVDSNFPGGEVGTKASGVDPDSTFISVDGSLFSGGNGLFVIDATLTVRNTDFVGGADLSVLRGYLLTENVTIDGAGLSIIRERYAQPTWLDGLTITNSPGPALDLWGWNFMLGANNLLTNNVNPVRVLGGLLPGTVVPSVGNLNNWVDAGNGGIPGVATWGALAVPYVVNGMAQTGGLLDIEPGTTVQFKPNSGVLFFSTGVFRALGTPAEPILFQAFTPGVLWNRLKFSSMITGPRLEHVVIEDAQTGVQADDAFVQVDASVLRNNLIGSAGSTFGQVASQGSQYIDNDVGVQTTSLGGANLELANPNSFTGNGLAVNSGGAAINARNNWWGHPSGPKHFTNPEGQGDPVAGQVNLTPFLTVAPDVNDSPPVVRLLSHSTQLDAGAKFVLSWSAEDDGSIVSQRVLFTQHSNFNFVPLAEGLPGDQRSIELIVPTAFPSSDNNPSFFKVVAIDDAGQEGFDEDFFNIPFTDDVAPSSLTWLTDLTGPFTFGDSLQVCWDYTGPSATWNIAIIGDNEEGGVGFGGGTTLSECWSVTMPYISTDKARFSISYLIGAGGRTATFYSPAFTIRPDARLGDAPPAITLLSPSPFDSFVGGSTVPISWTASDDEALRSFSVQASYDGGRSWHSLAKDLSPATTSFDWLLPTSAGNADVQVRAVAHDLRFQNSSDTVPIAIVPGSGLVCQPDIGFGGPGNATLSMCGEALASGNTADLSLIGAAPFSSAWLVVALASNPVPFKGGTLAPLPMLQVLTLATDAAGAVSIPGLPGGGGPFDVVAQFVIQDRGQTQGFDLSNALLLHFLP